MPAVVASEITLARAKDASVTPYDPRHEITRALARSNQRTRAVQFSIACSESFAVISETLCSYNTVRFLDSLFAQQAVQHPHCPVKDCQLLTDWVKHPIAQEQILLWLQAVGGVESV